MDAEIASLLHQSGTDHGFGRYTLRQRQQRPDLSAVDIFQQQAPHLAPLGSLDHLGVEAAFDDRTLSRITFRYLWKSPLIKISQRSFYWRMQNWRSMTAFLGQNSLD